MKNGTMQKRRVVITGTGVITPLGHNVPDTWAAILSGVSGIGPFTLLDKADHTINVLCEVKDFNPADYMSRKEARRRDRVQQLAAVAANEALAQSGLAITDDNRQRIGVIGRNGSGKSTLLRIIAGTEEPDAGTIVRSTGLRIASLSQDPSFPSDSTVGDIIGDDREAIAMADRLGLTDSSVVVAELSGGQRQSVAIAKAVYYNARIIIMDEPTAALGPAETKQVGELIKQLKAEGIGIFLISHDIHDVFDLADRISVVLQGKLVGTVNKDDVTMDDVLGMIIIGKLPDDVTQTELDYVLN